MYRQILKLVEYKPFLFRKRICFSGNSSVKISSSIRVYRCVSIYAEKKKVLMLKLKILHIYYEKISSFFLGRFLCKLNDNNMGGGVDIQLFSD